MKKKCPRCKKNRLTKFFSKNKAKTDGLAYFCKTCQRQYTNRHYKKNKDYYVTKAQRHKDVLILEMRNRKSLPCTDCKLTWPWFVMDFDHVRGKKRFNLADGHRKSSSALKLELAKCDLVCSNCHRIRTHKRIRPRSLTDKAPPSEGGI